MIVKNWKSALVSSKKTAIYRCTTSIKMIKIDVAVFVDLGVFAYMYILKKG